MELLAAMGRHPSITVIALTLILTASGFWCLVRLVGWAKRTPKGAYLFLALFPLISLFPIPLRELENVEHAKQEQKKNNGDSGGPPDEDAHYGRKP